LGGVVYAAIFESGTTVAQTPVPIKSTAAGVSAKRA
jgi:hypothetical protein